MIIGTPDTVKEKIELLARQFGVDEIVAATFADSAEDRLRSYALLAELFEIGKNLSETVAARATRR